MAVVVVCSSDSGGGTRRAMSAVQVLIHHPAPTDAENQVISFAASPTRAC